MSGDVYRISLAQLCHFKDIVLTQIVKFFFSLGKDIQPPLPWNNALTASSLLDFFFFWSWSKYIWPPTSSLTLTITVHFQSVHIGNYSSCWSQSYLITNALVLGCFPLQVELASSSLSPTLALKPQVDLPARHRVSERKALCVLSWPLLFSLSLP